MTTEEIQAAARAGKALAGEANGAMQAVEADAPGWWDGEEEDLTPEEALEALRNL